jgi:hypothetical protein
LCTSSLIFKTLQRKPKIFMEVSSAIFSTKKTDPGYLRIFFCFLEKKC